MSKIKFSTVFRNLARNFRLLFSALAALCLFLSPSLISLILTAIIFAAVFAAAALDIVKPPVQPLRNAQTISIMMTVLVVFMGFITFKKTWTPSSKAGALAGALGITTPTLLLIVAAAGCIAGAYAIYILACWSVSWSVKLLKKRLPICDKTEIKANLKRNWYFPISAMAFFCHSAALTPEDMIRLLPVFMITFLISTQISSIWEQIKSKSIVFRALSFATAAGICLEGQNIFYARWSVFSNAQALEAVLPIKIDIIGMVSVFGAVAAVPFVYFCVLLFWNYVERALRESEIFCGIRTAEWIVYGVILFAMLGYMVFSFTRSQAFYGTELYYDIIYTSDSPSLVKENVYLSLTHPENDLRQPLFAVFAAPFAGIPYLLARLFGTSEAVQAILLNSAQILMLLAADFMLAKMLKLDSAKRICFMMLTACTYTHLLFAVMMEQYIVAYFWLVFCMYLVAEKQQPDRIALWGAGGTLLTGMVLLPFMSRESPVRNFKAWFMDMVKYGLEFVALMLAFGRFDVILNLVSTISRLSGFTGKSVIFTEKLYQYTGFVRSCLIAPDAGVNTTVFDHISWQLNSAAGLDYAGIIVLVLALLSAVWNRDKKSSRLAAGWIGFSLVLLLGLGWGTKENGLILYTLYFGWAFLVLLFQLAEKIESRMRVRYLIPAAAVFSVAVLLIINIPAIAEMVNFAIACYPA